MDFKLFQLINQLSGKNNLADKIMILFSNKIRYVFLFVLIYLYLRNLHQNKVAKNAITSVVCAWIFHVIVKIFYYKPRPFMKRRVGILIPSKQDSSFPSKHTLLVFAASTSILFRERMIGLVMSILSFLTGFSRIWVGHHYPSDIILSAVIGCFISFCVELTLKVKRLFTTALK